MLDKDYLIKGDMYQYNLGWLIQELLSFKQDLATAIDLKTIKYADPIQWDITTQYPANTVVVDPKSGTAYMSKVPVPAGVELTNTSYWVVVFNYQDIYNRIMDGVAFNDRDQDYATKDLLVNDLVWYAGDLYRVTRAIPTGSKYIPGTNLIKTSIESLLARYYGRDRTAQVSNDTVNVSGDYTLVAGDIAETSTNRTIKVTKDREIDVDGSDSIHIDGVSTVNVGGLRTEVYAGDKTEKVTGAATEEYSGTHTENHTGKKIVNATEIVLNPTEPLTYGTPEKLDDYFNYITLKDSASSKEYKVLTYKDATLYTALNAVSDGLTSEYEMHRIGREALLNGYAQGSCWANNQLAQFIINDDVATLKLLNPYTGNQTYEQKYDTIFHANTCTYVENENNIYVTTLSAAKGSYVKYVESINLTTMLQTRVDLSNYVTFGIAYISYDPSTDIMYLGDFNTQVTALKWSTKTILWTKEYNLKGYTKNDAQSFNAFNGKLYFYTFCNIFVLNGETMELERVYRIPIWTDSLYFVGEIQSMAFTGDDVIITSAARYLSTNALTFTEYFSHNTQIGNGSAYHSNPTNGVDLDMSMNVDSTLRWNPNGFSGSGGAFNYYEELFLSLLSPFNRVVKASIESVYSTDSQFYAYDLKHVIFDCKKNSIWADFHFCDDIYVQNAAFSYLYISDSTIRIYNTCSLSGALNIWRSRVYDPGNIMAAATSISSGGSEIYADNNNSYYADSKTEPNIVVSNTGRYQFATSGVISNFKNTASFYEISLLINNATYAFTTIRDFIITTSATHSIVIPVNGEPHIVNIKFTLSGDTLTITATDTSSKSPATISVQYIVGIRLI